MKATLNRSKRLLGIEQAPPRHWVGDGFPVRSMFSYDSARSLSPFLLLDYAAPSEFPPAQVPLSGTPIDEPVVGYGPFVMNTEREIRQAIEDYRHGRMGHLD
jgi:redox-sensitive bicupin YhaK (pirin superfamily)